MCTQRKKLDSMRWFSRMGRTGGRHNCITYLLTCGGVAHCHACHAYIRLLIYCVVKQQTATFWGMRTQGRGWAYDPKIGTLARFLQCT